MCAGKLMCRLSKAKREGTIHDALLLRERDAARQANAIDMQVKVNLTYYMDISGESEGLRKKR